MTKRTLDLVFSLVGLLVTLPFYLFVALAIRLDSPGPVFYLQERVGLSGRRFRILKFRTMVSGADRQGSITVKLDPRVTRVGRWLRRYKFDELPTLFNVLKGDMSLVGPRPELPQYVDRYTSEQRGVLSMRPGITDLGTLRFDAETDLLTEADNLEDLYLERILPEKLRLNLEYVDKRSFFLDMRIVFETLLLIVRRKSG